MDSITNAEGLVIVHNLIGVVQHNKSYLSEIDGVIGDGDHGINMNKGFTLCKEKLEDNVTDLATGLKTLGKVLLMEIGGSLGPLYGTFFLEMSKMCSDSDRIDKTTFGRMLSAALIGVQSVGSAKVGDKTIVDTLSPAVAAFQKAVQQDHDFVTALEQMRSSAEEGKNSTKDMVAKIGRSSRLGERSRGVLDAGATSCYLILASMAESIIGLISSDIQKQARCD